MTMELDRAALQHAAELVDPLLALGDEEGLPDLLDALGWDGEILGITDPTAFAPAIEGLANALQGIRDLLDQDSIALADLAGVLLSLASAVTQIVHFVSSLPRSNTVPADALRTFSEDLANLLVEYYVVSRFPRLTLMLTLLGILKTIDVPEIRATDGRVMRQQSTCRKIYLETVLPALRDPLAYLRNEFVLAANGTLRLADAVADLLGPLLADGLIDAGMTASYGIPLDPQLPLTADEAKAAKHLLAVEGVFQNDPDTRSILRFGLGLADETKGLGIVFVASGELTVTVPLGNGTLKAGLQGASAPILITADSVTLAAGTGSSAQFQVSAEYKTDPSSTPALRFGAANDTRFEVGTIETSARLSPNADGIDVGGTIDLKSMLLAVQGSDGDGFLNRILPSEPIKLQADVGLDLSLRKGVRFRGSAGLEMVFPVNKTISDILTIETINLAFLAEQSLIQIVVAASANVKLGPISASVEKFGMIFKLLFPPEQGVNLILGFKAPDGAGLSLDASVITGGGFLFIDQEKGQYAGGLQLDIKGKISISAIGLINTKLPDGRKTFSLLVIISADDFPPIQLGYGFTLNGVGGLLGVNRTMMVDVLRAGIKNKVLDSIMFPKNIALNASKIISDLSSVFPPAEGRFAFGIMARIEWGEGLITGDLGIILELPSPVRLALLGRLQLILPDEKDAVLVLHLDSIGILNFDRSEASIDATLYDSRVVKFDLAGDMAMRLSWGNQPMFALAVGGFHPRFAPPPNFPSLARMSISLSSGKDFSLRLESYFALTANSLQFGARVDARVSKDFGDVIGDFCAEAYLGLDALVKWPPFWFEASISGGASLKRNGAPLVTVELYAAISGPGPWLAHCHAMVEFLGTHPIEFAWQSDDVENRELPPPPDTFSDLLTALLDPSSWSAQLDGGCAGVSLRKIDAGGAVQVQPFGTLTLRQRVLPIGIEFSRAGSIPLPQPVLYTLEDITVGGYQNVNPQEVRDAFAAGQFFGLSDDEKLSHPAFDSLPSGYGGLSGGQSAGCGYAQGITWDYEVTAIDQNEPVTRTTANEPGATMPPWVVDRATRRGAAGVASVRGTGAEQYANPDGRIIVRVNAPAYYVIGRDDLKKQHGAEMVGSYFEAEALLGKGGKADGLQVVGSHEVKHE